MRPGAQGSDARMCGGRSATVGTGARAPPDVRAARAASGSMLDPDVRMSVQFGVCMHAVGIYKSSPGQDSLAHARTQRGQSLGHGR